MELTRNNVARIHGILILNEAEAIHELDLRDLAGAMGTEVSLDLGLGDFALGNRVSVAIQKKHFSLGPLPSPGTGAGEGMAISKRGTRNQQR